MTRLVQGMWRQASLPAVEPGFQPGGENCDQTNQLSKFSGVLNNRASNPGGKMPPSTAGKDARRYNS